MSANLSDHPYATFMAGVQALRRLTEAETWGLGGALGTAADPYPHQLATVRRVLTDPCIRHLIADEVGLGKTVQVAMIINALRWRNPEHRTIIVAPDRLLSQWQRELWCRGHVKAAPAREPDELLGRPDILLLGPHDLATGSTHLDAAYYDLLVVDEPQSLPRDVVQRLSAACTSDEGGPDARFREVLILSATPKLGDPRWRDLLLPMIEPERCSIARLADTPSDSKLVEDEENAVSKLRASDTFHDNALRLRMFRRHAVTRRVIRNTRADWHTLLPERDVRDCVFSPNDAELARLELAEHLLARAPDAEDLSQQPWTTVRSLLRARRSVRAAIDGLGPSGQLAVRARQLALEDPGDCRLEALVDVLAEQWDQTPESKFVIVAGDAGSIDMLVSMLPRYFTGLGGENIAVLKRPSAGAEDTVEHFREMHEAVQPFIAGSAKLLILGDWVQSGLNLHHTSNNIIFYSIPWDVQAVDQLIGRIDRLRRNSFTNAIKGRAVGKVRIWRLIMDLSPEQRVVKALDALGVFQRPLPQVPEDDWKLINSSIARIARDGQSEALRTLQKLATGWGPAGLRSGLDPTGSCHWEEAMRCQDRINQAPVVEPSMLRKSEYRSVVEVAEQANEAWLSLLSKSGQWQIGYRHDRRDNRVSFNTFWYAGKPAGLPFLIRDVDASNFSSGFVPLLTKRRALGAPPRASVVVDDGQPDGRLLHFFDHGDVVHDDLVDQYRQRCGKMFGETASPQDVVVRVRDDHPLAAWAGRQVALVVGRHTVNSHPRLNESLDELRMMADMAPTVAARERLYADLAGFRSETEADQRWLRDLLQSRLILRAAALGTDGWEALPEDQATGLFKPLHWQDGAYEPSVPQPIPTVNTYRKGQDYRDIAGRLAAGIREVAMKEVASHKDLVIQAYRDRAAEVELESDRRLASRRARIGRRADQLARASDAQLQMIEGQLGAEERRLEFAEAAGRLRVKLLSELVAQELTKPTVEVWRLSTRFALFA